jgi:hypothetical protein
VRRGLRLIKVRELGARRVEHARRMRDERLPGTRRSAVRSPRALSAGVQSRSAMAVAFRMAGRDGAS